MNRGAGAVAVVLGTRPEIVKLAPVITALGERAAIVHTGQHYDDTLSDLLLGETDLPAVDLHLEVGGLPRGAQVASALQAIEVHLLAHRPAVVVVQGDTNSCLAGALAANACEIPLVHIEAGLRSYDRAMPEEHNRVLVDHLADVLCAPTAANVANLAREGIVDGVELTGNTVVEALHARLPSVTDQRAILPRFELTQDRYVLATIHRPENTDDPERLAEILGALTELPFPAVLPLHPRTAAAVDRHALSHLLEPLRVTEPLGHEPFLSLMAQCAFLVSDSGGVQEECTVLKRPVVVVRRSTERPESMPDFATLAPPDSVRVATQAMTEEVDDRLRRLAELPCPYGDGSATQRIVASIERLCRAPGSSD